MSVRMVWTSLTSGIFLRWIFSLVRRLAAIAGRTAFFEPLILAVPLS